ncbi:hypothetical protein D3C75_1165920 [compost metagenome]
MISAFDHADNSFFRSFEPMKVRAGNAVLLQKIASGQSILVYGMQYNGLVQAGSKAKQGIQQPDIRLYLKGFAPLQRFCPCIVG